jgi:ATP-dependent phosphofructokinase / diphosphate-dependent phosphofructokinase
MAKSKTRCIGVLTSGGDCPGLNAAIRGVVKAAIGTYGIKCVGILDGFRGLVENRTIPLDDRAASGILTSGGTILGTSRDKPHKMPMGGKVMDMTRTAVENAKRLQIDCLVCLGGAGTQKNAMRLKEAGLDVLTLPKTIDNDVAETDITFGFDTALGIATEAIDRLHTTATSHQRAIVVEIMGHRAGWLALGAGIAGGADVVLLPEIAYDPERVARHLMDRSRAAEEKAKKAAKKAKKGGELKPQDLTDPDRADAPVKTVTIQRGDTAVEMIYHTVQEPKASRLARHIQQLTGMEARVTTLGHVQRGGSPSAADRLLCTRLGTTAAQLLAEGKYNVMVAVKGDRCEPVALKHVAGRIKTVPEDHPWISTGRLVGTCFGD